MSNPYIQYYSDQVGTGLPGFQGVRYQRGHGFFGRLFSGIGSFVKGIAPSLFKKALPSAVGFAQDVISGENVGQSAKKRLKEAGKEVANETLDQIKTKIQKGSGIPNTATFSRKLNKYKKGRKKHFKKKKVNKSKTRR